MPYKQPLLLVCTASSSVGVSTSRVPCIHGYGLDGNDPLLSLCPWDFIMSSELLSCSAQGQSLLDGGE